MSLGHRLWVGASAVLCALVLASAASAQTTNFPMAGSWAQNRGNLIDIPITGDKPCTINAYDNPPPPFVMGDYGQPLRAANADCIPGAGSVTVMGPLVAPRAFTLRGVTRADAGNGNAPFFQDGITKQSAALPLVPTVIQLATNFSLSGPGSIITNAGASSGTPNGYFQEDAYLVQAGRAGANFAWCPGNATQNPNCTSPNPNQNGATRPYNGLVRYTAGANAFGGTMSMLLTNADGTLSVKFIPGAGGTVRVLHLPIGGMGAQHPGGAYANPDLDVLASGSVMINPVYSPGGKILSSETPNPTIMTGGTTNLNYGFPWTTGQVYVRNTGVNQGMPATTTLSATGNDARGSDGQGVITMVAGGSSHRLNSAQHFSAIDVVKMTIGEAPPLPSASPAGLAAGAALMLLAVGYAVRRRF